MKEGFGYFLSFLEQVAFLGVLAILLCFLAYDVNISIVIENASNPITLKGYFLSYMLLSSIGFPVIVVINVIGEKYFGLFDGQYIGRSFYYLISKSLYDNIAFSYYISKAIIGIVFRIDNGDSRTGTVIFFALWLMNILFILFGMLAFID